VRLYAQLLNRDLELSLVSIAYTLNVKCNTHRAIFWSHRHPFAFKTA